jgi:hypothetical protein
MKRIPSALVAVGASAILAIGGTSFAYAATGTFTYHTTDGHEKSINDPANNVCYDMVGKGPIHNNTNAYVGFYSAPNCQGTPVVVRPGAEVDDEPFDSLHFSYG